jgi:hypothetical protein
VNTSELKFLFLYPEYAFKKYSFKQFIYYSVTDSVHIPWYVIEWGSPYIAVVLLSVQAWYWYRLGPTNQKKKKRKGLLVRKKEANTIPLSSIKLFTLDAWILHLLLI